MSLVSNNSRIAFATIDILLNPKSAEFRYRKDTCTRYIERIDVAWQTRHLCLSSHRAYSILTFLQLSSINSETTDLEICLAGGRVLVKVGNFFLSDISL